MTSCRARGVPERGLKREYVHAPLHSVCGMAVPQLVWVNVEPGGASPLPANISNCLACEMPIPPGTREDELFIRAAAKREVEGRPGRRLRHGHDMSNFALVLSFPTLLLAALATYKVFHKQFEKGRSRCSGRTPCC